MELEKKQRLLYIDHLRVLATLGVILLHMSAQNWGNVSVNSSAWMAFNLYDSLVRWSVPVFVMISGALFLNRPEIPVKVIYRKYVLRMFTAYFFWGLFYYLAAGGSIADRLTGLTRTGKAERLMMILGGHYHMWFIPMMAGLYMCLPIIRQIVKEEKVRRYFLGLSFVFWLLLPQLMNLIHDFVGGNPANIASTLYNVVYGTQLSLVMNYVFYFILGYELSRLRFRKEIRFCLYLLGVAGFLFTAGADWLLSVRNQMATETYYGYNCVNVLLEAVAVFELYKNLPFREGRFSRIIYRLSQWSFGVYLVHAFFREWFAGLGFTTLSFTPALATPVTVLTIAVCSFAVSGLLHCIPVLKKYVV